MKFVKGAIVGTMVGTVIGSMNSSNLSYMIRKGKKKLNRMVKRYGI